MIKVSDAVSSSNKTNIIYPWLVCGLGALFYCYEYLLRTTPSVMTAELMQHYHLHRAALGNLVAFYYYAYTPMQLPVGILMDRFGPRRLLSLACLACAFGAYLFAGTHSFALAATGRFLVGFGSAFAFVGVLKLATVWLPADRFAMIAGMTTSLGMLGALIGDLSLTKLVERIGWQETVHWSAFCGLILVIAISTIVRDRKEGEPEAAVKSIEPKNLWRAFAAILTNVQIWLVGIIGSMLFLSLSVFAELWGIPYLEQARGFSNANAASAVAMVFLGWAIGGPLAGFISDKIKQRKLPILVGIFVSAIIFTIILYTPNLSVFMTYVLLFLFGVFSGAEVIVFAVGRENATQELAGTAIAVTNMVVMLGGAICQPLVGYILDFSGQVNHNNYLIALSIIPAGLTVAAFLLFFVKETHCRLAQD